MKQTTRKKVEKSLKALNYGDKLLMLAKALKTLDSTNLYLGIQISDSRIGSQDICEFISVNETGKFLKVALTKKYNELEKELLLM